MPSLHHLRAALQLFEAKARRSDLSQQSTALRISHLGEPYDPAAILIDLGNPEGDAIEITADGWQIVPAAGRAFRRSRSERPLPPPTQAASGVPSIFPPAALAWIVSALRPIGPYPILLLKGPAGSGKTMLARLLRDLIDPSVSPFCPCPRTAADVTRLVWNNYVLAFDDCGQLPPPVIAALCRLSSGAALEFDRSSHAADSLAIRLQRPIILTASDEDIALHREAASRLSNHAVTIHLPLLSAAGRRTEREILAEFERARPALLATVCAAVSLALGRCSVAGHEAPSRFADAFQWSLAAAPALGIAESEMRLALCPDTLAREVAAFAHRVQDWEGSPSELLAALQAADIPDLPNSPERLTRLLHAAPLSTLGVTFEAFRSTRNRKIRMTLAVRSGVIKTYSA